MAMGWGLRVWGLGLMVFWVSGLEFGVGALGVWFGA